MVISGAAGFVGSHLCDRMIAEGHEVIGLDNLLTGAESNLRQLAGEPRFHFIRHDVTEPIPIQSRLDGVLHLASPASPKDYLENPIETLNVGSMGTRNMLELTL